MIGFAVLQRAERRKSERVAPHINAAETDAEDGAETRPQRFRVAYLPQIPADRRVAPPRIVVGELVVTAPRREGGGHGFRRHDAGKHRVVTALDARNVHEPGIAADQRSARECELGYRLPASLRESTSAVGKPPAAFERVAYQRMRLETLEFLVRRKIGVGVIEVNDETDGDEMIVEMIKERAATGVVVEGPAERMLHQPPAMPFGRDLPKLLQSDAEFLRFATIIERKSGDQLLAEIAACTLGEQGIFGAQFHAAGKRLLGLAIPADAHVSGRDAHHRAVRVIENFGGRKAGIEVHPEGFGFAREPAAHIAE